MQHHECTNREPTSPQHMLHIPHAHMDSQPEEKRVICKTPMYVGRHVVGVGLIRSTASSGQQSIIENDGGRFNTPTSLP